MKTFSILKTAHVFDVDRLTVYRWIAKGCPVVEPGRPGKPAKLDWSAVLTWRKQYLEELGGYSRDGLALERAFHAVSQASGSNVAAIFQQYYRRDLVLTLELTQLLVWGGCLHEDSR